MAVKKRKKQEAQTDADIARAQMGETLVEALNGADANYKNAKQTAKSFSGEKVPAGKYEMNLSDIKFHTKVKDGVKSLSLQRTFTVLSGENEGMAQTDFMQMTNQTGLSFAMQFIMIMGYEIPDDPAEWADIVAELNEEAPNVSAEVVHSNDFVNVRVSELLDDDEDLDEDEDEDEDESGTDDSEEEEEDLEEELAEMERKELKAFIKEEDLEIKVKKSMSDEDIREAILAEFDED